VGKYFALTFSLFISIRDDLCLSKKFPPSRQFCRQVGILRCPLKRLRILAGRSITRREVCSPCDWACSFRRVSVSWDAGSFPFLEITKRADVDESTTRDSSKTGKVLELAALSIPTGHVYSFIFQSFCLFHVLETFTMYDFLDPCFHFLNWKRLQWECVDWLCLYPVGPDHILPIL